MAQSIGAVNGLGAPVEAPDVIGRRAGQDEALVRLDRLPAHDAERLVGRPTACRPRRRLPWPVQGRRSRHRRGALETHQHSRDAPPYPVIPSHPTILQSD
jgi:hypothetical protein